MLILCPVVTAILDFQSARHELYIESCKENSYNVTVTSYVSTKKISDEILANHVEFSNGPKII